MPLDPIEFEEKNWDWLIDKFLKKKEITDLWEQFIYEEYEDSLRDLADMEDK